MSRAPLWARLSAALWFLCFSAMIALVSNTYSLETQIGLGVLAVFALLMARVFSRRAFFRYLALGFAMVVFLRYWFWRLFDTLPGTDDPLSFFAAMVLFGTETIAIAVFFIATFLMLDPIQHTRPRAMDVDQLPSVDILVPSLNESDALLATTLAAARNIEYPQHLLRVVLCDDGGTDQRCQDEDPEVAVAAMKRRERLQELCANLGVEYMTRPKNIGAKAGNLNEAMQKTSGELVVVFDADHAPTTDFLARTVGYFNENKRLFLVQTPHFFINADPVAKNLQLPHEAPPENEMFYERLHEGLDRWGGTFFCGSAAVLRRTALDEIGGISGTTITEDAETALALHRRGWESMYLNHAMIAGLQPATLSSFIGQRGRWLTGMLQLLVTRNPLFGRGLNLQQRLCYLNSMSFWLFPLVRMVLLCAPLAYLFFGLDLFVTNEVEAVTFMLPYVLVGYMAQNMMYRDVRWTFVSEVYEIVQTPYLLWNTLRTLFRPGHASFSVTSKDEVLDHRQLSAMAGPLVVLWLLMAAGIVATVLRWQYFPDDHGVLRVVGAWALFNFIFTSAALGAVVEERIAHTAPRIAVNQAVRLTDEAGQTVLGQGMIHQMSFSEAQITLQMVQDPGDGAMAPLRQGQEVWVQPIDAREGQSLGYPMALKLQACSQIGAHVEAEAALITTQNGKGLASWAEILSADSTRWAEWRQAQRRPLGEIGATLLIFRLALTGLPRFLATALTSRPEPARAASGQPAPEGSPSPGGGQPIRDWSPDQPLAAQAFRLGQAGGVQGATSLQQRVFARAGIDGPEASAFSSAADATPPEMMQANPAEVTPLFPLHPGGGAALGAGLASRMPRTLSPEDRL